MWLLSGIMLIQCPSPVEKIFPFSIPIKICAARVQEFQSEFNLQKTLSDGKFFEHSSQKARRRMQRGVLKSNASISIKMHVEV